MSQAVSVPAWHILQWKIPGTKKITLPKLRCRKTWLKKLVTLDIHEEMGIRAELCQAQGQFWLICSSYLIQMTLEIKMNSKNEKIIQIKKLRPPKNLDHLKNGDHLKNEGSLNMESHKKLWNFIHRLKRGGPRWSQMFYRINGHVGVLVLSVNALSIETFVSLYQMNTCLNSFMK